MKIATVMKILRDNPIYSFKQYVINSCFYFMRDRIWFGISDLYAIKRYMRLSGMQLTDFVCVTKIITVVILVVFIKTVLQPFYACSILWDLLKMCGTLGPVGRS